MNNRRRPAEQRTFDFALVVGGVRALTAVVEDALYEAGCDDATASLQHGLLYVEFSRTAQSLEDAVLRAIRDLRRAKVGAAVLRVDDCDLVTASEIARRVGRSRQQVHQYIKGERGPGDFPAPAYALAAGTPRWAWSEVSPWFVRLGLLDPAAERDAAVLAAINNCLEAQQHRARHPELVDHIARQLQPA